jgi:hypothetical protein
VHDHGPPLSDHGPSYSLQAVLPFGMVLELGNSADAYCAVAQAQSLSQVKSYITRLFTIKDWYSGTIHCTNTFHYFAFDLFHDLCASAF